MKSGCEEHSESLKQDHNLTSEITSSVKLQKVSQNKLNDLQFEIWCWTASTVEFTEKNAGVCI